MIWVVIVWQYLLTNVVQLIPTLHSDLVLEEELLQKWVIQSCHLFQIYEMIQQSTYVLDNLNEMYAFREPNKINQTCEI